MLLFEIYLAGVLVYIIFSGIMLGVVKGGYVKSWPMFFVATVLWPIFLLLGLGVLVGNAFRR